MTANASFICTSSFVAVMRILDAKKETRNATRELFALANVKSTLTKQQTLVGDGTQVRMLQMYLSQTTIPSGLD